MRNGLGPTLLKEAREPSERSAPTKTKRWCRTCWSTSPMR